MSAPKNWFMNGPQSAEKLTGEMFKVSCSDDTAAYLAVTHREQLCSNPEIVGFRAKGMILLPDGTEKPACVEGIVNLDNGAGYFCSMP